MPALQSDIDPSIIALAGLLRFIGSRPYPDLSPALTFSCAAPLLQDARWLASLQLQALLEDYFKRREPTILSDRSNATRLDRDPSYSSRTPISREILDTAVDLAVMTDGERQMLMSAIPTAFNKADDVAGLTDQLQRELAMLRRVVSSCSAPVQPSNAPMRQPPTRAEEPNPGVDDTDVVAALEARFKSTIEREISGTIGRILVFKNPPNTSPERFAVKTIDPERVKSLAKHEAIARFVHEVKHWIAYRHSPFVIAPFYTEVVYGWPYVAMPYCECTMRQYINGTVPQNGLPEALALMIQVCCALQYARDRGLRAHQDLKPENVLLQDLPKRFGLPEDYPFHWRARLADFGMANGYLELKVPWGSRPYLAPEQYKMDADLSAVDVFACGVMLHELVTGRHPIGEITSDIWPEPVAGKSSQWTRENKWKKWARSENKLLAVDSNALGGLRDIVVASLSTEPDDRPSLGAFQEALLSALKSCGARAYENLLMLLVFYQCTGIYSEAVNTDPDAARYKLEHVSRLA